MAKHYLKETAVNKKTESLRVLQVAVSANIGHDESKLLFALCKRQQLVDDGLDLFGNFRLEVAN